METGWPKLDIYGKDAKKYEAEKQQLLKKHVASKMMLYAPTLPPLLTSAPFLPKEVEKLPESKDYLVMIKFHDLMAPKIINQYKELAAQKENMVFGEKPNIVKFLLMADIVISETPSVVYEFLLLDNMKAMFQQKKRFRN